MVTVNDIGIAAFLKVIKGFDYAEVPCKDGETRRFVFKFDIEESEFVQLRTEYINSPFRKFDSEIRDLKKLLNS